MGRAKRLFMFLCTLIYDYCIVMPLTKCVYTQEAKTLNRLFPEEFSLIDIGTGTGLPLQHFLKTAKAKRVLAIDINEAYVRRATQRFANDKRVDVRLMDFMSLDKSFTEKFDVVFFGFSFMLMPDKELALRKAANLVKDGGKIILTLTLYDKKSAITEFIKPKIKYLTSVDFGDTMYKKDIPLLLRKADFEEVSSQRLQPSGNFLFKFFNVYRYEVKPITK